MVAAIAQRPEAMWVFKIVGPPADVATTESAWRSFLQQVTFGDDHLPRWSVPEGWKELPGNSFRHATLLISGVEPPLELAVSRLPSGQDLLMNVNRWRGQLELEPLQSEQLETQLEKFSAGSETWLVFDASGVTAPSGTGASPMAMTPPAATNPAPASSESSPETALPFEFAPPDQWNPGPTTQFTLRRFMKTSDEGAVQLAMTRLQMREQSWADNVGVWCGELGIAALTADEVAARTKEIAIDGKSAKSIALESPAAGKASRIVTWSDGDESWFIKMTGDTTLMAASEDDFQRLLDSIRFSSKQ
jgi:hypothetical protein